MRTTFESIIYPAIATDIVVYMHRIFIIFHSVVWLSFNIIGDPYEGYEDKEGCDLCTSELRFSDPCTRSFHEIRCHAKRFKARRL